MVLSNSENKISLYIKLYFTLIFQDPFAVYFFL